MKHEKFAMLGAAAGVGLIVIAATRRKQYARSLSGKVVLITGGSRGFGLALAQEFSRHRTRIILTARNPEELDRARATLLSRNPALREEDVKIFDCDLTNAGQTQRMIARATAEFGRIDILVNNAGVITVGPAENQPLAAFQNAIESNYYTMLHATLAALPQMLERKAGRIVNITSVGGKVSVPHLLPYSASKFAAVGFSQGLHAEMRSKGIRVTTVCPGLMRTGSHTHALFTGDREREYRWFSLGASLPWVAASASQAARKVVDATVEGVAEITITPQALVAATLAQALPGCTAMLMHWVNTLILPKPVQQEDRSLIAGMDVRGKELTPLIHLGRHAARRYNEEPASHTPGSEDAAPV